MKFAVENDEISKNPALYVTLPEKSSKPKKEVRWFNENEIKLIKAEALRCYKNERPVHRLGYIFPFLINTGMRIGEALALQWNDVDFEKETISVKHTVSQIKNRDKSEDKRSYKLIVQSVKTKNGNRIIPLNNEAMTAIKEMKKINFNSDFVFASDNGSVSSAFTIDKTFRTILKKCGLVPTGVHSLRHTCASILFRRGCDPKYISHLLGHSEVFITYETYIHFIQEQNIDELKDILNDNI